MSDSLPLPPELQHLIEKRQATERRNRDRRRADVGPVGAVASGGLEAMPAEDRRRRQRRAKTPRRGGHGRKRSQ